MQRSVRVPAILSLGFLLALAIVHYRNLTGSADVRPILVVSLIAIGMILGVMLTNVFGLWKTRKPGLEDGRPR
ncbi:MAG: hypothetical protein IPN44_01060 [Flavobacteriales bacterium]|nr:hypothetical protein [Flavobacteriales bacterium]